MDFVGAAHVSSKAKDTRNFATFVGMSRVDGGMLCMVTEYGSDVRELWEVLHELSEDRKDVLAPKTALPDQQFVSIAQGVLDGLLFLHGNRTTHGNLNPHTVGVTSSAGVKIRGFGGQGKGERVWNG